MYPLVFDTLRYYIDSEALNAECGTFRINNCALYFKGITSNFSREGTFCNGNDIKHGLISC